jgi:hypothetical protein
LNIPGTVELIHEVGTWSRDVAVIWTSHACRASVTLEKTWKSESRAGCEEEERDDGGLHGAVYVVFGVLLII